MKISWYLAAAILALQAAAAHAESISGPAVVRNADIISINEQRVILWGIDAPEPGQTCFVNTREWGCYDAALRQLELLTDRGDVTCTYVGEPDIYGRRFGVCESAGQDIAAEMVLNGMALAYLEQTDEYAALQMEAITEQRGLWQPGVEFLEPWVERAMNTDNSELR